MITSNTNKKIKELKKLQETKYIKKNKKYLIEGEHLVEEALRAGVVKEIFLLESYTNDSLLKNYTGEKTLVAHSVMKTLANTVTSQGILALCEIEDKFLDINMYKKVLILDKVQDPGNLGTIIRTADAFSFDAVILGKGTVNLYSQKTLRSMQGSNFHIDCFENIDLEQLIDSMNSFDIYATSLQTDMYLEDIENIGDNVAIIFGNEGAGVSETILAKVNNLVKIKMTGKAESLNVGVSAGILMHYINSKVKQ